MHELMNVSMKMKEIAEIVQTFVQNGKLLALWSMKFRISFSKLLLQIPFTTGSKPARTNTWTVVPLNFTSMLRSKHIQSSTAWNPIHEWRHESWFDMHDYTLVFGMRISKEIRESRNWIRILKEPRVDFLEEVFPYYF